MEHERQLVGSANHQRRFVGNLRAGHGQGDPGIARQQGFEQNSTLPAGERRTEAMVHTVAEGQVPLVRSADVEGIRVRLVPFVPVRRGDEQQHRLACRNRGAGDLEVLGGEPPQRAGLRTVVAKRLLSRRRPWCTCPRAGRPAGRGGRAARAAGRRPAGWCSRNRPPPGPRRCRRARRSSVRRRRPRSTRTAGRRRGWRAWWSHCVVRAAVKVPAARRVQVDHGAFGDRARAEGKAGRTKLRQRVPVVAAQPRLRESGTDIGVPAHHPHPDVRQRNGRRKHRRVVPK